MDDPVLMTLLGWASVATFLLRQALVELREARRDVWRAERGERDMRVAFEDARAAYRSTERKLAQARVVMGMSDEEFARLAVEAARAQPYRGRNGG